MTRKRTMGKHGRLREEDAAREKANPTETDDDEDTNMARPKSSDQIASNEAMRRKVAEQHQADPARNKQQSTETDPAQHDTERTRREGPGPDPASVVHQAEIPAAARDQMKRSQFDTGSITGVRKSDEDPKVGAAGREPFRNREAPNDFKSEDRPADMHGMQAEVNSGPKASKDQKPTAEFNIAVALHPELLDPNREGQANVKAKAPVKRMHISDDLASELSYRFAHHEISYTETGIMVRSGGESILIDEAKIGKLESRADLRRYIATLPAIRHG